MLSHRFGEIQHSSPTMRPASNSHSTIESSGNPDTDGCATELLRAQPNTPVAAKRRNPVACRRCRRLRARCTHQSTDPPCEGCQLAGPKIAAECYFPRRGEKDLDRLFRRRQIPTADGSPIGNISQPPASPSLALQSHAPVTPPAGGSRGRSPCTSPSIRRVLMPAPAFEIDDVLPPWDEVIEGCRIFVTSYFQLGFIPKAMFLEDLISRPESINKFLLACILSISARFTPSLAKRYGNPRRATDHFLDIAKAVVPTEMYRPSLERIQAFFLLAISQWGNGDRDKSSMDMGVAVRMAALLKLHCEESYFLDKNCPTEQVIRSESARRVFWMIQSQENLHSGYKTPAPFPLEDITTLLPCSEADFAFGAVPTDRAALAGTPPAIENLELVHSLTRCLFATLVQAHGLWGIVARRAGRTGFSLNKTPPWDEKSDHKKTLLDLQKWEESIPPRHAFSIWNLRGWKSESLHLAYLSITMVLRLSNIVIRCIHLENMLSSLTSSSPDTGSTSGKGDDTEDLCAQAPAGFWEKTSDELFSNVWRLYEQIEAFVSMRAPDEGFPQILVFCVYISGSLATYLWRNPTLCPALADKAETMTRRALEVLSELHVAWPTSSKWQRGLQQIATPSEVSPASEHTAPTPSQQTAAEDVTIRHFNNQPSLIGGHAPDQRRAAPRVESGASMTEGIFGEVMHSFPSDNSSFPRLESAVPGNLPDDLFNTELDAFLHGGFHYDLMGNWGMPGFAG